MTTETRERVRSGLARIEREAHDLREALEAGGLDPAGLAGQFSGIEGAVNEIRGLVDAPANSAPDREMEDKSRMRDALIAMMNEMGMIYRPGSPGKSRELTRDCGLEPGEISRALIEARDE